MVSVAARCCPRSVSRGQRTICIPQPSTTGGDVEVRDLHERRAGREDRSDGLVRRLDLALAVTPDLAIDDGHEEVVVEAFSEPVVAGCSLAVGDPFFDPRLREPHDLGEVGTRGGADVPGHAAHSARFKAMRPVRSGAERGHAGHVVTCDVGLPTSPAGRLVADLSGGRFSKSPRSWNRFDGAPVLVLSETDARVFNAKLER